MKKSVFMFLATVATVAAVGLALTGCAGSPKAATSTNIAPVSSIEGSWYRTEFEESVEMGLLFENGVWTITCNDDYTEKGTYEIQNGTLTMLTTHIWNDLGSGPAWLSPTDVEAFLLDEGLTPKEVDYELGVSFAPETTASFKLTDRTLTLYGVQTLLYNDLGTVALYGLAGYGEAWETIWQKR